MTDPRPRTFVKMAYDSSRRRMTLFGGYDGSQMASDTWGLAANPPVPGDIDGDGDVDLDDFNGFAACMTGPGGSLPPGCIAPDLEETGDVDLEDFATFQRDFSG